MQVPSPTQNDEVGEKGSRDPGHWGVSTLGIIGDLYIFFIFIYIYIYVYVYTVYIVFIIYLLLVKEIDILIEIYRYICIWLYIFFYTFLKVKNIFVIPFSSSVVVMFPINMYVR